MGWKLKNLSHILTHIPLENVELFFSVVFLELWPETGSFLKQDFTLCFFSNDQVLMCWVNKKFVATY